MRVHKPPKRALRVSNRLGRLAAEKGLSQAEVGRRAAEILGHPLDPRTLRRHLEGEPIVDSTMATVAALARAIGVGLDEAFALEPEESVDEILARAGIKVYPPATDEPLPPDWGKIDPAWGDLVGPFLEERDREF
jgi:transcriptional regulator with XRE-family HTH domain